MASEANQSPAEPARRGRAASRSRRPRVPGRGVAAEGFVTRIFTLADHAAAPRDGKLYIAGAGVTTVNIRNPQAPFPPLFLVARVAVPYAQTSEPHRLTIRLLNADREPPHGLPDPLHEDTAETGRPPGVRAEDELCISAVLGLFGLPLREDGMVFFHLEVDGQRLATLPLRIRVAPQ